MQNHKTIARPYAKALFSIASEKQQCPVWAEILPILACLAEQPAFYAMTMNPAIASDDLTAFIVSVIVEQVTVTELTQNELCRFINILHADKRLAILPSIADVYLQLWSASLDTVNIEVFAAYPLNPTQQQQFQSALSKRFATTVDIEFNVDPDLIGGALIRHGSWVMDGSVRGKLSNLIDLMRG